MLKRYFKNEFKRSLNWFKRALPVMLVTGLGIAVGQLLALLIILGVYRLFK